VPWRRISMKTKAVSKQRAVLLVTKDISFWVETSMIHHRAHGWKLLGCQGHMEAFVEVVYYKPNYFSVGDARMFDQFIVVPWQLPVFEELPKEIKSFPEITLVRPFEEYGYCMRIGDPVEVFNINDTRTEARITGEVQSTRLVALKDLSSEELKGMSLLHDKLIITPGNAVEFLSSTYGVNIDMQSVVTVVQIGVTRNAFSEDKVEELSERGEPCTM